MNAQLDLDKKYTQLYHCVMIPSFDNNGNLPPGMYTCTLPELETRFAHNEQRKRLFIQFKRVIEILTEANCKLVYLNGSFITSELYPNDFDICYEPTGLTPTEGFKLFLKLDIDARRDKYGGDIFPRMLEPPFMSDHVRIWQTDRNGEAKGIIRIVLKEQEENDQK